MPNTESGQVLVLKDGRRIADGLPTNNHVSRAATFNPQGQLTGATSITLAGNYAYLTSPKGLFVVDVSTPTNPHLAAQVGAPHLREPRRIAVQFRYGFVCDADGLKVLDLTFPERPRTVTGAVVPLAQANDVYLARTYAYVAAGSQGLAIVEIEKPEHPRLDQTFDAGGALRDARGVKVAMTNVSLFAYMGDGKTGLHVVELSSSESVPGNLGWSPRPAPRLVAHHAASGGVVGISEGYRRDRAVDESGNQLAVFGRRGARPFNLEEQQRIYLRTGKPFFVTDEPPGPPREGQAAAR